MEARSKTKSKTKDSTDESVLSNDSKIHVSASETKSKKKTNS